MLNQLRADNFRLRHTLGIYLTLLFTIVYSAFITGKSIVGGILVTDDSMDKLDSVKIWTIKDGINASTLSSSLLLYVLISIFVIIIGTEFSQKTYKNTLVSGITRTQFVLAKYVLMLLSIFVLIITYFLTSVVMGMILSRTTGSSWSELMSIILKDSLVIAFFISVIFGLGILILFLTSSIVFSSIFIVVCPIFVTVLNNLVDWSWLKYIDFFRAAVKISLRLVSTQQIWIYILTSMVVLIITIFCSVYVINNKEL
ncbi:MULTISPECIES: ABC transporter permease [unclassified Companilactobacillus]|uniref:ABC transporter permease n=1 Tax=unclassified Companilactobacillus TaxID=2767904 RepID=UPI002FEEB346